MTTPAPQPTSQPATPAKNTGWCQFAGADWGAPFPWPNGDCPCIGPKIAGVGICSSPVDPGEAVKHAAGDAAGVSGIPTSFRWADIANQLGKGLTYLLSPDFWKSTGLLLVAAGVGGVGLVLWLGKGQDVEKAAMA